MPLLMIDPLDEGDDSAETHEELAKKIGLTRSNDAHESYGYCYATYRLNVYGKTNPTPTNQPPENPLSYSAILFSSLCNPHKKFNEDNPLCPFCFQNSDSSILPFIYLKCGHPICVACTYTIIREQTDNCRCGIAQTLLDNKIFTLSSLQRCILSSQTHRLDATCNHSISCSLCRSSRPYDQNELVALTKLCCVYDYRVRFHIAYGRLYEVVKDCNRLNTAFFNLLANHAALKSNNFEAVADSITLKEKLKITNLQLKETKAKLSLSSKTTTHTHHLRSENNKKLGALTRTLSQLTSNCLELIIKQQFYVVNVISMFVIFKNESLSMSLHKPTIDYFKNRYCTVYWL